MPKSKLNLGDVASRDPSLSNEGLTPDIIIEEVQSLVDELLLPDHILPGTQTLANSNELATPGDSGVVEHSLQVLETSGDLAEGVRALVDIGVDREQGGAHGLRDLANLGQEAFTVSEDDEDILEGLFVGRRVGEGLINVGVVHVQVATENTPEDAFKDGDTAALDGACNESIRWSVS
jgi:hypothetical protein